MCVVKETVHSNRWESCRTTAEDCSSRRIQKTPPLPFSLQTNIHFSWRESVTNYSSDTSLRLIATSSCLSLSLPSKRVFLIHFSIITATTNLLKKDDIPRETKVSFVKHIEDLCNFFNDLHAPPVCLHRKCKKCCCFSEWSVFPVRRRIFCDIYHQWSWSCREYHRCFEGQ